MPLDPRFHAAVAPLHSPDMGTETLAPLLYYLVRSCRPQRVLEVGMGYTTPFLLEALKDNLEDFERDRRALEAKTLEVLSSPLTQESELRWLTAPPAFGSPRYYLSDYRPALHAIDDFSLELVSSAGRVRGVVEGLGSSRLLQVHQGSFRGHARKLQDAVGQLDFVWFDCGAGAENRDFVGEYWPLVNRDGGYLLIHCALNMRAIAEVIQRIQRESPAGSVEVLNLLEPHKLHQGSVAIVRRTEGSSDAFFVDEPDRIRADAAEFLQRRLVPSRDKGR